MREGLGVYIDVFPLDGIPKQERELMRYIHRLDIYSKVLKLSIKDYKGSNILVTIAKRIICPMFREIGYRRWLYLIVRESKRYFWEDSEYVCNVTSNIMKDKLPKDYL